MKPGGIFRAVVPDLHSAVEKYLKDNDADGFIESTYLTESKPKTIARKLFHIVNGHRNHHWMYDGTSMIALLTTAGFHNVQVLKPGITTIPDPGDIKLFDHPPPEDNVYVEAVA
jgi:predicted SAM-dependent methyltransferase